MKVSFGSSPLVYDARPPSGHQWYDSKEEIVHAITSLDRFAHLAEERHCAGYDREETLSEFYVFGGRFRLDRCGNTLRASADPLPERFRVLAPVLTHDEFWQFHSECRVHDPRIDTSVSYSLMRSSIPTEMLRCGHCNHYWKAQNAYDTYVEASTQVCSLNEFMGSTLADVHEAYFAKRDVQYVMQPEMLLRRDEWIDHSLKYPHPRHSWERDAVVNKAGWRGKDDGVNGATIIKRGDETYFNIRTYFHTECFALSLAAKTQKEFHDIFVAAGFIDPVLTAVPNEYGSQSYRGPWYTVPMEVGGVLRVGWRKRVIEIDWSGCHSKLHHRLAALFAKEETTHTERIVHANDSTHAVDCLSRIRSYLELDCV